MFSFEDDFVGYKLRNFYKQQSYYMKDFYFLVSLNIMFKYVRYYSINNCV